MRQSPMNTIIRTLAFVILFAAPLAAGQDIDFRFDGGLRALVTQSKTFSPTMYDGPGAVDYRLANADALPAELNASMLRFGTLTVEPEKSTQGTYDLEIECAPRRDGDKDDWNTTIRSFLLVVEQQQIALSSPKPPILLSSGGVGEAPFDAGVRTEIEFVVLSGPADIRFRIRRIADFPAELHMAMEKRPAGWFFVLEPEDSLAGSRFDVTIDAGDNADPNGVWANAIFQYTFSIRANPLGFPALSERYAHEGEEFEGELSVSGGTLPLQWEMSWDGGDSPADFSISPDPDGDGRIALLSGTPAPGSARVDPYRLNVRVTDSSTPPQSKAIAFQIVVVTPLAVATVSLPPAQETVGYTQPLLATGGVGTHPGGSSAYDWSASSGLPDGLSIGVDGSITGTPARGTRNASPYRLHLEVEDAEGTIATSDDVLLYIEQSPNALRIATDSLETAIEEVPYPDFRLMAEKGVAPYAWSEVSGLPDGLSLSPDGAIVGAPADGSARDEAYFVIISVTDSDSPPDTVQKTFELSIPRLRISIDAFVPAQEGVPYAPVPLSAEHGADPFTWEIVSGTLPDGIELDSSGQLSGTPDPGTAGASPYIITLRVSDTTPNPQVSDAKELALVVEPPLPLALETTSLRDAHEGERYQTALRASGGNKTYTFTVDGLPEGIEFRVLDTLAGPLPVIEGIPALGTVGQYLVRIRVEDSSVPPMTQLDGLILEVLPDDNAPKPLRFHTTSLPPATSGEFYDPVLIEISGGTPDYSLTMSGTPTGLALEYDARIGAWIFYGTTEISKPRSFPVTFTATDASSPMLTTSVTILLSVYVTEEGMPPPLEPDGQAASIGVPVLNGAAAAPQCSLSDTPNPAGIPVPALLALMAAFLMKAYGRRRMGQDAAHPH